ncbi:shikimate kinase [Winogradskyella ursingii]|uniref:shikimate kinase n=1 Tax=Winogradskyella ursingii TaxID=2686079 RepID=UPI0015CE41F6|nr:shikimate kinase [Winogradskyella ursingii]
MVIVLMGYMGCGKSTIGKQLATVLNYSFLDLDDYISSKEKMIVPSIFEKKGEIYFRKMESKYLERIIVKENNLVLALGGGTPCYANNMEALLKNKNVKTFYLKLPITTLAERLFTEKEKRPLISLIKDKEMLLEFIGKHLFERTQYYSQAEFKINGEGKSVKTIVEEIVTTLV